MKVCLSPKVLNLCMPWLQSLFLEFVSKYILKTEHGITSTVIVEKKMATSLLYGLTSRQTIISTRAGNLLETVLLINTQNLVWKILISYHLFFLQILTCRKCSRFLLDSGLGCTSTTILKTELTVLKTLDYRVYGLSPLTYIETLLEIMGKFYRLDNSS